MDVLPFKNKLKTLKILVYICLLLFSIKHSLSVNQLFGLILKNKKSKLHIVLYIDIVLKTISLLIVYLVGCVVLLFQ